MNRYKKPYFKLFCGMCDILDEIEELIKDENITKETRNKLTEMAERIRLLHIEAEECVIAD